MIPNPDYDTFLALSYPGIMGEQVLTLTSPSGVNVLHVVLPEVARRVLEGID